MTTARVLGIFAHPDDESLVAGGTLAACAAAGFDVAVLCLTRGEQGPIADPALATRDTLDRVRESELRAAAALLGVRTVECLAYPDGELDDIDSAGVTADLARRIVEFNPHVLITFGPEGWYWHPDHVAVHRLTMAALDMIESDERETDAGRRFSGKPTPGVGFEQPSVYHATCPKGHMQELLSAMAARGLSAGLWGLDPAHFGVRASRITTVLDVRPFLVAKLNAVRSHRTQLSPEHIYRLIPDDLAAEYLGREYFMQSRAGSAGTDWLEQLPMEAGSGPMEAGSSDPAIGP
jgi:LmbE family N-acetylglucosaminyl deacetylase